ncbi:CpaF family protein [Kineosporia sp. J2-2]|uniref:CpaF family protein n=1 Tax=Kineosporia corallincola TaxID=2835133 RepID=A0ABS5TQ57_9ACTN|nr:ATPase, T2SS/T4P/T4SS family [Kineosporia corallincola]MBT0773236.1 CpaF family protein [Kineosporia corallincola]
MSDRSHQPGQGLDDLPLFRDLGPATAGTGLRVVGTDPAAVQGPETPWAGIGLPRPGVGRPLNRRDSRRAAQATGPLRASVPNHDAGLDWALVAAFRDRASRRLTEALTASPTLTPGQQRELARKIVFDLLDDAARDDIATGSAAWRPGLQQRMAETVFDALFGLGRLQPLVDDPDVENIMITGCDRVMLEYNDGQLRPGPPVAESDDELIEFLAFLASRSEVNARSFSESQPRLHLRLDGGARLAATAWVTPRPVVVIRRHRLVDISLDDLVDRQMLSPLAAGFLAAAVRARKSIVVSGPQGAGKTTMVRALCAEIPPWERIGTFETEYELFLHELPGREGTVIAYEARPGTGERAAGGRQAGEITLDELLYDSFRFNLQRQIVGEVRGKEIIAMIKAMQSGAGSISTTHAATAVGAIRKLVTCAMEAGPHITESYAQRAVAEDIDVIVQVHLHTDPGSGDGRDQPVRTRWVSEIVAVHPGEQGPARTTVFGTESYREARALASVLPDEYRELAAYGFDLDAFAREAGS